MGTARHTTVKHKRVRSGLLLYPYTVFTRSLPRHVLFFFVISPDTPSIIEQKKCVPFESSGYLLYSTYILFKFVVAIHKPVQSVATLRLNFRKKNGIFAKTVGRKKRKQKQKGSAPIFALYDASGTHTKAPRRANPAPPQRYSRGPSGNPAMVPPSPPPPPPASPPLSPALL